MYLLLHPSFSGLNIGGVVWKKPLTKYSTYTCMYSVFIVNTIRWTTDFLGLYIINVNTFILLNNAALHILYFPHWNIIIKSNTVNDVSLINMLSKNSMSTLCLFTFKDLESGDVHLFG